MRDHATRVSVETDAKSGAVGLSLLDDAASGRSGQQFEEAIRRERMMRWQEQTCVSHSFRGENQ